MDNTIYRNNIPSIITVLKNLENGADGTTGTRADVFENFCLGKPSSLSKLEWHFQRDQQMR